VPASAPWEDACRPTGGAEQQPEGPPAIQLPPKLPKLADLGAEARASMRSLGASSSSLLAQPSLKQMLANRAPLPGTVEVAESSRESSSASLVGPLPSGPPDVMDTRDLRTDPAYMVELEKVRHRALSRRGPGAPPPA
jgi:hypothetical protein